MLTSTKHWLIALAGLFFCQVYGDMIITGHESPLIIGVPRNITCTWSGEMNVTKMEWFVTGLDALPVKSEMNSNSVILAPDPNTAGLAGTMFTCRATTTNGSLYEETITLELKELDNIVTIQTSSSLPLAGENFTLTCNVVCDRPPQVKWLDPTGQVPTGQGITLSPQTFNGQKYSLQMHFDHIRTSYTGIYTCVSNVVVPPSSQLATRLVRVQLPEPNIVMLREPEHPLQLYTTDSLTLTCIVDIDPAIDTRVVITAQWSGHSSLTNEGRRVVVSELEGVSPSYSSIVTFTTLKSIDSGSYVCSAKIVPEQNPGTVEESYWGSESIAINVGINVTIDATYNPPSDFTLPSPPYYRPATSITLTCHAHNAAGRVTYQWSSTCTNCFASRSTSQSISDSILTSSDAGVHTCTVTDQDGNTGNSSTQMQLIGAGIYVSTSTYVTSSAVANNTFVVPLSQSCETCASYNYWRRCTSYSGTPCTQLSLYCYSNSTSSSARYLVWPSGYRYHAKTNYYHVDLSQQSPGGLYIRNNFNNRPYGGVYTCRMPDSNENIIQMSIAIYTSRPSAPHIQAITFNNLLGLTTGDMSSLATVTCSTRNSPPTNVTWMKDGKELIIDDEYRSIHEVTNRGNSYYNVKLIISDLTGIGGVHNYTCVVNNTIGGHWKTITTNVSVWSESRIIPLSEPVHGHNFTLSCVTHLQPKLASLSRHLVLEWVGPDGVPLMEDNNITIGEQTTFTTTYLHFSTINLTHHGVYSCRAMLNLPNLVPTPTIASERYLSVLDRAFIQLNFSPIIHCTYWYMDKRIAPHLEQDIKNAIANVVESNCNCNFTTLMIDEGEFSCQTSTSRVTYRARVTGNSETLSAPEILAHIQNWLTNDGTFLYTYHGKIRLRVDSQCPLQIKSFTEPEYGGGLQGEQPMATLLFAPHKSSDEL